MRSYGHSAFARSASALLLSLSASLGVSQEVRATSDEVHQYLSPMVLELRIDPLFTLPVGTAWTTADTRRFVCRGVSIESLTFTVKASHGHPAELDIRAQITNGSAKDKIVLVLVHGISGDKVQALGDLSAKIVPDATWKGGSQARLEPSDAWDREPRPILQLTVRVADY